MFDAFLELLPTTPAGWVVAGVLLLALLAILIPWILLPPVVHARLRLARPRLEPRPVEPRLPPEAELRFGRLVEGLSRLGYRRVADLFAPDFIAGSRLELTLFRLADSPWGAVIMTVRPEGQAAPERVEVHLQLGTRFVDGSALVSGNTPVGSRLPNRPAVALVDFPGLDDPAQLERAHRGRLLREGRGREVLEVAEAELASAMERDIFDDLAHGEASGLLRREGEGWRPTFRGALRLGWSACWPVSAWVRWRGARRANALLRDLGVESAR